MHCYSSGDNVITTLYSKKMWLKLMCVCVCVCAYGTNSSSGVPGVKLSLES